MNYPLSEQPQLQYLILMTYVHVVSMPQMVHLVVSRIQIIALCVVSSFVSTVIIVKCLRKKREEGKDFCERYFIQHVVKNEGKHKKDYAKNGENAVMIFLCCRQV